MATIVIIDYGMGNLGSILNMLKRIGVPATVSSHPKAIESADRLILPGVGAFDAGMRRLHELGIAGALSRKVLEQKVPLLGICLGMQLLTHRSEEGDLPGLGWIEGETRRFKFEDQRPRLRIPHMGWNTVRILKDGPLFTQLDMVPRFYFVHSYHVVCDNQEDVLATTEYGYEFASAVSRGNIIGTQFHPEKSHKFGMAVLRNFVERV